MHLLQPPSNPLDPQPRPSRIRSKLSAEELLQLTQQLATLLQSGIALPFALQVFREGQRRSAAKTLLNAVELELAQGQGLANAFGKFPETFNNLYQRLVAVGESSGTLERSFHHLAKLLQRKKILQQKTRTALAHPLAILSVACSVSALLLLKVVPTFEQMFGQFGHDLPTLTLAIIDLSQQLQVHGIALVLLLLSAFTAARYAVRQHKLTRLLAHRGQLFLPIFGPLAMHRSIAGIARILATSLSAGLPMMEALDFARSAPNNTVYAQATATAAESVHRGSRLYMALQNTRCFPTLFTQMVMVGEQSGMLDNMLSRAAEHYEARCDETIDRLIPLLEPAMMVILGGLIAMLLLAMYLPLFQMGSVFG
jgi:type IV pilus assembly protein PilC